MWHYYEGVRPFKPGAFKLAVKHKLPIIPIAINYRHAKGLAKLIRRKPLLTVNVGEPIPPINENGSSKTNTEMLKITRQAIQKLAGFDRIIPQTDTHRVANS